MKVGRPSINPFDIFESFGGGGVSHSFGGRIGRETRRMMRCEDVVHPLKVSLEDHYNGTSKKLSLSRNILCSKCKGKRSKSGASSRCPGCQGGGMKVTIRHLGPSMIQQMQHVCQDCKGSGDDTGPSIAVVVANGKEHDASQQPSNSWFSRIKGSASKVAAIKLPQGE